MMLRKLTSIPPAEIPRRAVASLRFRLAERRWRNDRDRFGAAAPERYRREFSRETLPGVRIFSFCGKRDISLQIISILSFLRHVATPASWTVVSDDSLTPQDEERLRGLSPVVSVSGWTGFLREPARGAIEPYAALHPLGKKLAIITGLPEEGTSVFVDSDVIFFAGGGMLRDLLATSRENHFLRDRGSVVVGNLATPAEIDLAPVNSGFLVKNQPFEWADPLARLATGAWRDCAWKGDGPTVEHFLEQTVVHIACHAAGARQLDAKNYVINYDDAFDPVDRFSGPDVALRHYTWNTRLKFWSHVPEYLR